MIFDGNIQFDQSRAIERIHWLINKGKRFEIKEKRPMRSLNQNRYLHLILTWYALEYGETVEYIKQEVFKKQVNPELFRTEFINQKTGEIRDDWKSTADLDTKQMTEAIDRFRNYASKEAGIYLPEPNDLASMQQIEHEISKQKHYQYL